jgi:CheY-like chemotaxis protein
MIARVLVVEDNQPNRELLTDWLEAEGFEVLAAENLEQAYSAFMTGVPHAVLLDVQLGAEDGLSLAAWMRSDAKLQSVPIIAVTAHAMVTDRERVVAAGCNACVSKPIDFAMLSRQIDTWLAETIQGRSDAPNAVPS